MEGSSYGFSDAGNDVMYLTEQEQRPQSHSLARDSLASSSTEVEEHVLVGSFYEIDHSKLPSKTPEQLYSVRVVMVCEKAQLNTSFRFPSVESLRTHFSDENFGKPDGKKLPALDEKYVMGSAMAAAVLYRRIPAREMAAHGNLWSFWAAPSLASGENSNLEFGGNDISNVVSKKGSCWSELKFTGMVQWGKRRQVRFLGRHEEHKDDDVSISTANYIDEEKLLEEEENGSEKEELEEDVEEEGVNTVSDAVGLEVKNIRSSKRKVRGKNIKTETLRRAKRLEQSQTFTNRSTKKKIKNSIERWSPARYKLAEDNMLKIMKAKGAVFENPILRPALRSEARKLIGDTGLLDHLLKHMAGKLAPGGNERFRRRHNSDGAMEYWLESAELVDIRREAGVQDPYWTPPPGWKLGDNPTQDPICARELEAVRQEMVNIKMAMHERESSHTREIKELRDEMAKMKKYMQELLFRKPEEDFSIVTNQGDVQENIQGGDKAAAEDKAARIERLKSSFRICKPQGTFVWPDMQVTFSQAGVPQPGDPLLVPTPPSASSITSAPALFHTTQPDHGPHPPSAVRPLAKRPAKAATISIGSPSSIPLLPPPRKSLDTQMSICINTSPSLINLNETPQDQSNIDVAAMSNLMGTKQEKRACEYEKQHGNEGSSTCSSQLPQVGDDGWLALATQNPALNDSNLR